MTKERRLAIQMWRELEIINSVFPCLVSGKQYKKEFCARYNLTWTRGCWFCQYMPSCSKCPLQDCPMCDEAVDSCTEYKQRLVACEKMMAALKGEYKIDPKEVN